MVQSRQKYNISNVSRRRFLLGTAAFAASELLAPSARAYAAKKKKTVTKKYKIVYKLGGGTNPDNQVVQIAKGKTFKISKIKNPKRTGYTFAGWYKDYARTIKAKKVKGSSALKDRRLYAKWTLNTYTISYVLDSDVDTSNLLTSYSISDTVQTLPEPSRQGYAFVKWARQSNPDETFPQIPAGYTGSLTLCATWEDVWNDYMTTRCVLAASLVDASTDSFIYITDVHVPSNAMNSPELIEEICEATDIDMVVCGGDLINGSSSQKKPLTNLVAWTSAMDFTTVYHVRGNHDMNNQEYQTAPFTEEQYLEYVMSDSNFLAGISDEVSTEKFYYYKDNTDANIRYLFLDTKAPVSDAELDDDQITWLKARLTELEEGWTVIIFMHIFFKGVLVDAYLLDATATDHFLMTPGSDLVRTIKELEDDDALVAEIAAVVVGHAHRSYAFPAGKQLAYKTSDGTWEYTSLSFPVIGTACDAYEKRDEDAGDIDDYVDLWTDDAGVENTISEQLFEVFGINTEEKTINILRVGAGANRQFVYGITASTTSSTSSGSSSSGSSSGSSSSGSSSGT